MGNKNTVTKKSDILVFKTEKKLQDKLLDFDLNLPGKFNITFFRKEVPVGNCVPDFIYIRFNKIPRSEFLPNHCSFKHSYILWLLKKRKKLRPETIATWSYELLDRIRPLLDDLIRSETIIQLPSGSLTLSNEILEIEAEVVAVETKLYSWTTAINQAEKYLKFANRVFVAMDPMGLPQKRDALKKFKSLGIGLCEVGTEFLNWIVSPAIREGNLGAEREYLIASSSASSTQVLWSRR